jgi:malonate transporter and related proteins
MTAEVLVKLAAILATVALGWLAARLGLLGPLGQGSGGTADDDLRNERSAAPGAGAGPARIDPAQVLSNAAFYLFVPALLFRTMVRQDLSALPGRTLAAYFVPAVLFGLVVYLVYRRRAQAQAHAAAPATRAVSTVYGNAVQMGIPLVAALYGEAGLALHIALVSVHGLVLLTLMTVLVESDLARLNHAATRWDTLRVTARNTLVHPVVLPIVLGLLWNFTGLGLHPVLDQTLQGLGSAVVPLCLVLTGVSLATYGVRSGLRGAVGVAALKLLVLPAVVLAVAHGLLGLTGTPLAVLVLMAALPVGNNALIFAQRYGTLQAEATVAIVVSTLAFVATGALWLAVLGWLAR